MRCRITLHSGSLGLAALLVVGASEPGAADPPGGAPASHVLARGEAHYFYSDHMVGAEFTELAADGSYRLIAREHMFVAVVDSGRWVATPSSEILLCSHHHYRPLWADDLNVFPRDRAGFDRLPTLIADIHAFLETHSDPTFTSERIVEAWPYPASRDLLGVVFGPVTRRHLEDMASALDRYVRAGDANLQRIRPRGRGGCVYLLTDDPWSSDEDDVKLDVGPDGTCRASQLAVAISARDFAEGIGKRQAFQFYPEVGEVIARVPAELRDKRPPRIEAPLCGDFAR